MDKWFGSLLLGLWLFTNCAGTPKPPVETPPLAPESPVAVKETIPPKPAEGTEGVPIPREGAEGERPKEGLPEKGVTAAPAIQEQEKPSEEKPKKLPELRVYLHDGFTFSVPNPVVRWWVDAEGARVRVELSKDPGFSDQNLLLRESSVEGKIHLPALEQGKEYYLRLGIEEDGAVLSETLWSYRIDYHPFSVPTLPVLKPGAPVTFTMGYDGGLDRERPEHPVTLTRPFHLGTYEITNEEFAYVMNRLVQAGLAQWEGNELLGPGGVRLAGQGELQFGSQFGFTVREGRILPVRGREKHPVVGVSWYGALAFCFYLSIMEGLEPAVWFDAEDIRSTLTILPDAAGYRIPTEAEWEYAARGDRRLLFPGGELNPRGVNFHRSGDPFEGTRTVTDAGGPTTPVGYFDGSIRGNYRTMKNAGPFGHYDLLGNAWEWCADWFDPGYYRVSPPQDPEGPPEGTYRSVRGGAWNTQRQDLRYTMRGFFLPEATSHSIGFRIARTEKGEKP